MSPQEEMELIDRMRKAESRLAVAVEALKAIAEGFTPFHSGAEPGGGKHWMIRLAEKALREIEEKR
jgi:hypothetical protein